VGAMLWRQRGGLQQSGFMHILVVNSGSSSIKFSMFESGPGRTHLSSAVFSTGR
jgi:hypothetical protein